MGQFKLVAGKVRSVDNDVVWIKSDDSETSVHWGDAAALVRPGHDVRIVGREQGGELTMVAAENISTRKITRTIKEESGSLFAFGLLGIFGKGFLQAFVNLTPVLNMFGGIQAILFALGEGSTHGRGNSPLWWGLGSFLGCLLLGVIFRSAFLAMMSPSIGIFAFYAQRGMEVLEDHNTEVAQIEALLAQQATTPSGA